ncbi:hypothetical protein SG34_008410 [Thalassomonas viridans]|uniref:TolC family protein n=1 Tax=Thalassomonas viridans TaxID=137584 RepID=A0AAF0CAI4_9GAMM|nr:hypothetical protein [Thalassomonas viridans]WDE06898.1 hypothetical protein SG34_008410 [Thalassomonas viridans]
MKLAQKISVLAIAFFSITSAQALELVKADTINHSEVMSQIKVTLADSIKLTPVSVVSAQQTAQALLAKQELGNANTTANLAKSEMISE